ncbi:hypothetical protein AMJ57_02455 [Parcubacteria bacterium SG8_24]|nr:MAG: hypothetical protein AMJ57_02455 [Parcubacteria bacterium SG8_24]
MNVSKVTRLKEDERVLLIVRHLWVVYILRALLAALLIGAPFFFMIPLMSLETWGLVSFSVSVIAGAVFAVRLLWIWYWNAFVITTYRIVDIDQHGFFDRVVSEAPYEKIQDVSYGIRGVWGTLFRYGTVVVQTAGANTNLELPFVKHPKDVQHLITSTAASFRARSNGGARSEKVADLLDAASDLTDAEARAFLVAVQEAVSGSKSEFGVREIREREEALEEFLGEDGEDDEMDG